MREEDVMLFKTRVVFLSSIGFALGMLLGIVITAVSATMTYADGNLYLCTKEFDAFIGNPLLALIIQAVASGVYGMIGMGGSSVYYIEEWSLIKATVSHFFITVTCFYITSFFLRWISPADIEACLIMLIFFIIPYVMIWTFKYLSYRSQIMDINKGLLELKAAE